MYSSFGITFTGDFNKITPQGWENLLTLPERYQPKYRVAWSKHSDTTITMQVTVHASIVDRSVAARLVRIFSLMPVALYPVDAVSFNVHPMYKPVRELGEWLQLYRGVKTVSYTFTGEPLYVPDDNCASLDEVDQSVFICPKCGGGRWGTANNNPDLRDFSKATGSCNDCPTTPGFTWPRSEDAKYFFHK